MSSLTGNPFDAPNTVSGSSGCIVQQQIENTTTTATTTSAATTTTTAPCETYDKQQNGYEVSGSPVTTDTVEECSQQCSAKLECLYWRWHTTDFVANKYGEYPKLERYVFQKFSQILLLFYLENVI